MTPLPRSIERAQWDLQRFGLSPGKLAGRIRKRELPKVFVVSLPKAGTHLVERALCLHSGLYRPLLPTIHPKNVARWGGLHRRLAQLRAGQVLVGHLPFSSEYPGLLHQSETLAIFVIRDPRDVVVSAAHYIESNPRHYLHHHLAALPDFRDQLLVLIRGEPAVGLESMGDRLRAYAGWLDGTAFRIDFEDLTTDELRRENALRAMYDHLGLPLDSATCTAISQRLISSASPTFRVGEIGAWRSHFDDELLAELELAAPEALLARYGY